MKRYEWPQQWEWEKQGQSDRVGKTQLRADKDRYNRVVVLHTTENSLVKSSAIKVARWQNTQKGNIGASKRYSGYHFLVDSKQIVGQCNPDLTKAYHAGKSLVFNKGQANATYGNAHIGVSMVARESRMPYSEGQQYNIFLELLDNVALVGAELYRRYNIPPARISPAEYEAGRQGWLGHHDVAVPAGRKSDPGENFPWDLLMKKIEHCIKATSSSQVAKTTASPADSFTAEQTKWLKQFVSTNIDGGVTTSTLRYMTSAFRAQRDALGEDKSISATDYGKKIAELLRKVK